MSKNFDEKYDKLKGDRQKPSPKRKPGKGKKHGKPRYDPEFGKGEKPMPQDDQKFGSFDSLKSNDISWWNQATGIYEQATKIPFNRILGDTMAIRNEVAGTSHVETNEARLAAIPGCMVINFVPTLGSAESNTDAINLAMDRLYGYIYQQYTGAANFTKADVAFQVIHEVSIACLIACAKRGLRALYSYSPVNHNFPRLLYTACGFNPQAFDSDISAYPALVKRLNQVILSFNSLYTPRFTAVFDRWYSLCNNVWIDDADVASQMYLFRPTGYYLFSEAHDDVPSQMTYTSFKTYHASKAAASERGIESILDYIYLAEQLLASIRNTTYFNIVNASIGKAFNANSMLSIDPFIDGEIITPIPDRNMNWQINNCLAFPWTKPWIDDSGLNITEDVLSNTIKQVYTMSDSEFKRLPRISAYFLNSYDGTTDSEFIMEATRLMPTTTVLPGDVPPNVAVNDAKLEFGTEIPHSMELVMYVQATRTTPASVYYTPEFFSCWLEENVEIQGSTSNTWAQRLSVDNIDSDSTAWTYTHVCRLLGWLTKFRNHPLIYTGEWGSSVPSNVPSVAITGADIIRKNAQVNLPIGDVYKFTLITPSGVIGLHDAAKLSIYTMHVEASTK